VSKKLIATAFAAVWISSAAHAATIVVVPDDYASIQDAIDATQGKLDAVVRIDSNRVFDETLHISQSIRLEAGPGFHPVIRGRNEPCAFTSPGNCTIDVTAPALEQMSVVLSGLRLVPAKSARPGDRIVQFWDKVGGGPTLALEGTTLDNRGRGTDGLAVRGGFEDSYSTVTVRDGEFLMSAPATSTRRVVAVDFAGTARLELDRARVVMSAPVNTGVRLSNPDRGAPPEAQIVESFFDLAAKKSGLRSEHVAVDDGVIELVDNLFFSRSAKGASIAGLVHLGREDRSVTLTVDRNTFRQTGTGDSFAALLVPRAGRTTIGQFSNNVVSRLSGGVVALPASGPAADQGGFVALRMLNNTLDRVLADALRVTVASDANVAVQFVNNLVTRSGGWAARLEPSSSTGSLKFDGGWNGYYGNSRGNVTAPFATFNDVKADPKHLSVDDLRLRDGSPMIDAGSNDAAEDLLYDRNGLARKQTRVDIGAYETSERKRRGAAAASRAKRGIS
jgi:hypothetical protein